jgi:hypothetical protein
VGDAQLKFERWCEVLESLPRKRTRVLTWPSGHRVRVHRAAGVALLLEAERPRGARARALGLEFDYRPRPNWSTYGNLLEMAAIVRRDLRDLRPRDMIDIQSFLVGAGLR